ncbi:S8 family peptidase [Lachnoclostridium phytofermentans]|jgi:subtilisin family serine protease|uniref:S8 family peptidase n=1 Tax=Lachnoclostridium phytofermentans TaxID=66219 RepID=UPI000497BADD|nr:S8 family peptidase [Lachnoclostridium phytofermentans]
MVNELISEEYFDLIVPNILIENIDNSITKTTINARYSIINIPRGRINPCELYDLNYSYLPACYSLESTVALEVTGVKRIQNNPNFELFGAGVLIGIIDSGINYLHPAFRYADNSSKIQAIWDQTLNEESTSGDSPDFPYGTIYTKEEINLALTQSSPLEIIPSDDEIGHGTMIAGIVAGSIDEENDFSGVAPLSELVVVKLKQAKNIVKEFFSISTDKLCYQESDIMMGIKFVTEVGQQLKRPIVICIALGTNQGGHDGVGPLSNYLATVTALPRTCSIISAGNEGNSRRHFTDAIKDSDEFKEFDLIVGETDKNFFIEIWLQPIQRISLEIVSPTGEKISNLVPGIRQLREHSFIFGPTIVCVNNIISEAESGDQLIWIRFQNTQSGLWRFRYFNMDRTHSELNAWLPAGDIISDETYFLKSSPYTTITSPGNSVNPITIASYNTEDGGISIFSSKGYTRRYDIKPDFVAPGSNITAPSNTNGYVAMTGTGAAAAITTGIAALLFEWAVIRGYLTTLSGIEVKALLIRGAYRDPNLEYPNRTWGYGKVDLYGVFEKLVI